MYNFIVFANKNEILIKILYNTISPNCQDHPKTGTHFVDAFINAFAFYYNSNKNKDEEFIYFKRLLFCFHHNKLTLINLHCSAASQPISQSTNVGRFNFFFFINALETNKLNKIPSYEWFITTNACSFPIFSQVLSSVITAQVDEDHHSAKNKISGINLRRN